jgi:hypothetical protein
MTIETYPYTYAQHVEDIIYTNGPLLVHSKIESQDILVHFHDIGEEEAGHVWNIFPVTKEQLTDYFAGNVSLRTLFEEVDRHMRIWGELKSPLRFEWLRFTEWNENEKPPFQSFHFSDLIPKKAA